MTSNHLLLYRLTQLMLEYEQHNLPVDALFEDEQIGDFVKSIQIDSPYQQMLFEGVLTETVRDEKLYVSFTVEGYFHYVLGEVINDFYYQKSLNKIVILAKQNKLVGIERAIELCLIRNIYSGILKNCITLAHAGLTVDILTSPISDHLVLNFKELDSKELVEFVKAIVKSKPEHIKLLKLVIIRLRSLGQNEIIKYIVQCVYNELKSNFNISEKNKFQIIEILLFFSSYLNNNESDGLCQIAIEYTSKKSIKLSSEFYSSLGLSLKLLKRVSESIAFFEMALDGEITDTDKEIQILGRIANCFVEISLLNNDVNAANKAITKFKIIDKKIAQNPMFNPILKATHLNNYAKSIFIFFMKKWEINFTIEELKKLFDESFNLTVQNFGYYSDLTAKILNNISMFFAMIGNLNKSLEYCKKGFKIVEKVFPYYSNDTAIFAFNVGNRFEQMDNVIEANKYYKIAFDINQKEGRIQYNKQMCIAYIRVLKKLSLNDLANEIENQYSIP